MLPGWTPTSFLLLFLSDFSDLFQRRSDKRNCKKSDNRGCIGTAIVVQVHSRLSKKDKILYQRWPDKNRIETSREDPVSHAVVFFFVCFRGMRYPVGLLMKTFTKPYFIRCSAGNSNVFLVLRKPYKTLKVPRFPRPSRRGLSPSKAPPAVRILIKDFAKI